MRLEPLVTIVTVTYNVALTLEKTIKSVLEQTYKNIEYIIIDGNSSDNTQAVIERYSKHISYWVSEPDKGIYDAMNKAIKKSQGTWINFMNAGDSFVSLTTVEDVVNQINIGSDIVCGNSYIVDPYSKSKNLRLSNGLQNILKPEMPCVHQSAFIHIDAMKKFSYNDKYKIAADYDFFLKLYINNYKFQFIDIPIANFVLGGLNQQERVRARAESLNSLVGVLENPKDFSENLGVVKAFEPLFSAHKMLFYQQVNNMSLVIESIINEKKKVIIYGYGSVGKILEKQLGDCVVAIADVNFKSNVKLIDPCNIDKYKYDYVLISLIGREEKINYYLQYELNIELSKIKTINLYGESS